MHKLYHRVTSLLSGLRWSKRRQWSYWRNNVCFCLTFFICSSWIFSSFEWNVCRCIENIELSIDEARTHSWSSGKKTVSLRIVTFHRYMIVLNKKTNRIPFKFTQSSLHLTQVHHNTSILLLDLLRSDHTANHPIQSITYLSQLKLFAHLPFDHNLHSITIFYNRDFFIVYLFEENLLTSID